MGLNLKKLTWKKVGKGVGKVLDNKIVKGAAALGLAATGVGAPAAAAIMGGAGLTSKLAQGKRLTTALKSGAKDGALTYAGAKILPKVTGKLGGMMNKVPGVGGGDPPILDGMGVPGMGSEPGRFRSIASSVGKFVGGKDGFGMDDVLSLGKAAGSAYGAYDNGKRMNRLENIATDEFNANAPLREAGRAMLADQSRPDLSSVFADPQQRYRRVTIGSRVA